MPGIPGPTDRGPDARVLGYLLLVQSTVHALPTPGGMGEFLCRAMSDLPGVAGAALWLDDRRVAETRDPAHPDGLVEVSLPLETVHRTYGRLAIGVDDQAAFEPYELHVRNLANVIAMALENRHQAELLQDLNAELRREVAERTAAQASLRDAHDRLERTVEARTAALQASEGRLRLAQDAARIGIWDWDLRSRAVHLSDWHQQFLSLDDALPAARLAAVVHPDDLALTRMRFLNAAKTGGDVVAEFRTVSATGPVRWLSVHGRAMRGADGRVERVAGITIEITDRKRLEDELLQAQKLESIGHLAGGVAHDFNNILTAILGFTDMAASEVPEGPAVEYLAEVRAGALRAADLTRQLLAFGRRQVSQPRIVDLNALIGEIGGMLRRLIGEDVDLRTDLEPDLWPVLLDPGQVGQVLTNLAVNARDAMPRGGRLTIQTGNVRIGEDNALARGLDAAGDFVLVKVGDTGVGMTEEVGARIFEPFFTTKAPGRGTGLGLASAYGIVKQSRGHIWVESRIGEGTTFTIAFPRATEDVIEALRAPDPIASPRGRETILLAEDDLAIRTLASRTLRALGYRVLDAADGPAALELARAQEGPVHLLITDVVMPRGGGADLARQVRAQWPGVALLFVSGYPEAPSFDADPAAGTVAFLHKPYSQADLASTVRETLDGAAGMVGSADAP